jgi:hypothetical protein
MKNITILKVEGVDREVIETDNNSASDIVNTIEFLLICLDCKHQTPYGYLWFARCDGREHVLISSHIYNI